MPESRRSWDDPEQPADHPFLKAIGIGVLTIALYVAIVHVIDVGVSPYDAGRHAAAGVIAVCGLMVWLALARSRWPLWGYVVRFVPIWILLALLIP